MPPEPKQKRPRKSRAKGTMKSAPKGRKHGKPAHEPTKLTRAAVNGMACRAEPHARIAGVLGISPDTLRRHYAEELDGGPWAFVALAEHTLIRAMVNVEENPGAAVKAAETVLSRKGGETWREPKDDAATATVNLVIQRAEPSLTEAPVANEPSVTPAPDAAGAAS
jgi:hypothetical protein